VCSRSSCPPPSPAPRCRPTASISSMKMMQGACAFPCSNRSRTRDAPTPTNISTKSDPDIEKNGRPASPATALASSVFPVPGGPIRRGRADPAAGRVDREQLAELPHHVPPRRERSLEHAPELLALDDVERIDVALLELRGELGVRDVHRLKRKSTRLNSCPGS